MTSTNRSPVTYTTDLTLEEPRRHRYFRFGLPTGLGFGLLLATYLGEGWNLIGGLFILAVLLVIAQAIAMSLLTAYRIEINDSELAASTPVRRVRLAWEDVGRLEIVDRRDRAFPRRIALIRARGDSEFFVLDSLPGFELLIDRLKWKSTQAGPFPMARWKRFLLLQWGV